MDGAARGLIDAFQERFPDSACAGVWRAPGRVNLIGEHTDYNLGFVLPVALDMACYVARGPAAGGRLNVHSRNMNDARSWPVSALPTLQPSKDWSDYVAGVAVQLVKAGYPVEPSNLFIHSAVPFGGGLSSSASLEVSVALALLGDRVMDRVELAKLARRAENEFAGMPCGIMDQYISVFGQEDSALKIDCRSLEFEVVRLPAGIEIVAVNTMVKHELGGTAYRERVAECAAAAEAIRRRHPEVASLRDANLDQLELIDGVPRQRARHIITENRRVEDFVAASARGDLAAMGALFVASHRSLQHDYEVSCEELDFLVETATAIPGVYGSRMTGGGFGGCTVNLLEPGTSARFQEAMAKAYRDRFAIEPRFYPCKPSHGARRIA
ncbi:MAG: galactokinase [Bryobacteraceae bacterium]|nr:galactokinase [Bryobacteraceae bacterium]